MTLTKLTEFVFVLEAPTNIGIVSSPEGNCIVIDTGIDESIARKLLRETEKEGLKIKGIINTHSHADHIGGNSFIVSRTGAAVYCSPIEGNFVKNSILEPMMLVGGANPWKEMKNKFLMAKSVPVTEYLAEGPLEILDINLDILALPGHSAGQIGVLVDQVLFTGDAYISENILSKHGIPYNINIEEYLLSINKISSTNCLWYVPSHGKPSQDISYDLEINKKTVLDHINLIETWLAEPKTTEDILVNLCSELKINVPNTTLYFLYKTAVTAYLSYLVQQSKATTKLIENKLYWQS